MKKKKKTKRRKKQRTYGGRATHVKVAVRALRYLSARPRTVHQLAKHCGIGIRRAYRMIERLGEAGVRVRQYDNNTYRAVFP